ncbi:uncharacterized protein LOC119737026 [Patiria miniata]|uniref:Uncharacterized protein n=1 Tax=Patiria miniata TaxID=46514 RepID=A0A914AU40_PATMI|nr:uncharacterized protein LOC119737026 [Patiria miniata]
MAGQPTEHGELTLSPEDEDLFALLSPSCKLNSPRGSGSLDGLSGFPPAQPGGGQEWRTKTGNTVSKKGKFPQNKKRSYEENTNESQLDNSETVHKCSPDIMALGQMMKGAMESMQTSFTKQFQEFTQMFMAVQPQSNDEAESESAHKVMSPKRRKMDGGNTSHYDHESSVARLLEETNPDTASTTAATSENNSEQNELLANIAQDFQIDEQTSDAVHAQLASIANSIMRDKLSDDKVKDMYKTYNRPKNCEKVIPTKVNKLIWDNMSSSTRSQDVKFQKIQTSVIKSVVPVLQLSEQLLQASKKKELDKLDIKPLLRNATDAIALMANANYQLNMRRREFIKQDINPNFKHLCDTTVQFTEQLFGDDLPKQVKDMSEVNKVGLKLAISSRGGRARGRSGHRSYDRGGHQYRGARGAAGRGFLYSRPYNSRQSWHSGKQSNKNK